jgi:redox-sensitive bicupin YhaK (pirin superfamily)
VVEQAVPNYIVLGSEDYRVLGEAEFGMPGLKAVESIGPFVRLQASGPLITVHDATIKPHLGIGHHPHRHNERLFYIMEGELDHDDALNGIKGHIGPGDVGLFTEGQTGMLHSEWNNGDAPTRAYILVYTTNPIPEQAMFTALRDGDAPRYEEAAGVRSKELVGPRSGLGVHGDIRLVTDTHLEQGTKLTLRLERDEGGLLSVQAGQIRLDGQSADCGDTVVVPPAGEPRSMSIEATDASRLIRVVHGRGHGFIRRSSPRFG